MNNCEEQVRDQVGSEMVATSMVSFSVVLAAVDWFWVGALFTGLFGLIVAGVTIGFMVWFLMPRKKKEGAGKA